MKYEIKPSHTFKKELKQAQKRGLDISKLVSVVNTLAEGKTLEAKYKDHALTGNYKGYRHAQKSKRPGTNTGRWHYRLDVQ